MTTALSTLDLLVDSERCRVFLQLLDRHPELRDEAEQRALEVLSDLDRDTVASQVRAAVESVSTGHVAAISGRQPRGGYVDHFEASTMLLQESVEPFVERLRALAEASHQRIAAEVGTGILLGLEQAKGDETCAIYFDDQFAEIHADHVIDEMERAGVEIEDA